MQVLWGSEDTWGLFPSSHHVGLGESDAGCQAWRPVTLPADTHTWLSVGVEDVSSGLRGCAARMFHLLIRSPTLTNNVLLIYF